MSILSARDANERCVQGGASKHEFGGASRLICKHKKPRAAAQAPSHIAMQYLASKSRPYNPRQRFDNTMIKRL
jgi:hypothetical protein